MSTCGWLLISSSPGFGGSVEMNGGQIMQHKTFLFTCGKWISADGKLASPESHISICLPQIKSSSLKEAELSACCLLPPIHQSTLS